MFEDIRHLFYPLMQHFRIDRTPIIINDEGGGGNRYFLRRFNIVNPEGF